MRILIIQGTTSLEYPSGELSVISSEKSQLKKRHTVQVDLIKAKTYSGALLILSVFNILWSWRNYRKVVRSIEEFKPDIIHFHTITPYLSISTLMAAKKNKIPVVQTLHNERWLCVEGGFYRNGKYCDDCVGSYGWKGVLRGCGRGRLPAFLLFLVNFYARFSGQLFGMVGRFVAVSSFVRNKHIQSRFPEDRVVVNNNGIDIDQMRRAEYIKPWTDRSGVAFAGRVSVAKGSDVLKYLISTIHQPFHIIGNGPELLNLRYFCQKNRYENVIFWGKQSREKTLKILSGVICTVVPSQCGETFSMVAAESMALGTPVVASNLGGLSDLVDSGGGIVINPRKFDQFSDAILRYVKHPSIAEEAGQKGQKYVFKYLSIESRGDALVQIYDDLLNHS